MGIVIRQSIKNSIVTYIGVCIGMLNVLFLYNKFLSTEQLGLYAALTSFSLVFSAFSNLGTSHVGIRFFNRFADAKNKHNGFLGYLLVAPFVGFMVFFGTYVISKDVFLMLYRENSPLLVEYYWYFPAITFFLLYISILEVYCRVHLRIVVPAIIREIFLKVSNSCLALLFGFSFISFNQLILGIILSYFISVCFLFIYMKILGILYLRFDFSFLRKPVFKEMWHYGFWTIIGGALAVALPHIEKLMLPDYKGGLNTTAIFSIALSIAMVIGIPRNAIVSICDPLIAGSWNRKDTKYIEEMYKKSALILLLTGLFLFLLVWCNIDSVFDLIPKSEIYKEGKFVVLIVGLYSLFDMATGLNSEVLKNSPFYKYDFIFYIFRFALLLVANIILIPIYSYNGAALAMLVSVVIYNLVKLFFIKKKLSMQPFNINTFKVVAIGGLAYIAVVFLPDVYESKIMSATSIALKSLIITAIFLIGVFYFNISPELNSFKTTLIARLKKLR